MEAALTGEVTTSPPAIWGGEEMEIVYLGGYRAYGIYDGKGEVSRERAEAELRQEIGNVRRNADWYRSQADGAAGRDYNYFVARWSGTAQAALAASRSREITRSFGAVKIQVVEVGTDMTDASG
jgi:hypothetical protein